MVLGPDKAETFELRIKSGTYSRLHFLGTVGAEAASFAAWGGRYDAQSDLFALLVRCVWDRGR